MAQKLQHITCFDQTKINVIFSEKQLCNKIKKKTGKQGENKTSTAAFWPNRCCNSTVKITHTCSCRPRCTVGWLIVTQAYQRRCHPNNFGHQRRHRQKATQSVSVLDAERVHHGHVLLVSHRLSEEKTTFKRDAGEVQWRKWLMLS